MNAHSIYSKFIKENNINNIFSLIPELSYTQKYTILNKLLVNYKTITLNKALNVYKLEYIDIKRVDLKKCYQLLKYYCERYHNELFC